MRFLKRAGGHVTRTLLLLCMGLLTAVLCLSLCVTLLYVLAVLLALVLLAVCCMPRDVRRACCALRRHIPRWLRRLEALHDAVAEAGHNTTVK